MAAKSRKGFKGGTPDRIEIIELGAVFVVMCRRNDTATDRIEQTGHDLERFVTILYQSFKPCSERRSLRQKKCWTSRPPGLGFVVGDLLLRQRVSVQILFLAGGSSGYANSSANPGASDSSRFLKPEV